jgi:hypothetical protein
MMDLADARARSALGAMSAWRVVVAATVLVTAYVLLANDGRHHWHEFREIHSARFYSNAELMAGQFDPGPSPLRAPEEVATWYANKLLHIAVLRLLIDLCGGGLAALVTMQTAYAVMVLLGVLFAMATLRNIGTSVSRTRLIGALVLLSPLSLYLAFKTLEQVPALVLATAATAFFTTALYRASKLRLLLVACAGILGALSALASWTGPPLVVGLVAALFVVPPLGLDRRSIVVAGAIAGLTSAASMIVGLVLLGGSVAGYVAGLVALAAFSKALPMWLFAAFNAALFGAALWAVAPLAWLSGDSAGRRRFLVWLLVALVPAGLGAGFLEPRYLLGAIVPLAGLVAMGLEASWDHVCRSRWSFSARTATVVTVGLVMVAMSAGVQPFMPYESDQHQLTRLVRQQSASGPVTILVPWNYSDFHLLRFAFPDIPIYLVQSAASVEGRLTDDPAWTTRYASFYGRHFLPNGDALVPRMRTRTVLVGWTILPSLANLHDTLNTVGLHRIASRLEAFSFRNHLTETWIWADPRFVARQIGQYGQYRLYEVHGTGRTAGESSVRSHIEIDLDALRRAQALHRNNRPQVTNGGSRFNVDASAVCSLRRTAPFHEGLPSWVG